MEKMKLSLSNGVFSRFSIEENFKAIKKLGFENIEFNMKAVRKEDDTDVYREQKALESSGLDCLSLHSACLNVRDPIEVHQAVYYGKISLECAHALRAPIVTVHSNVAKNLPMQTREKCLSLIFKEIKRFADELGIKLSLENLSNTSTGFGVDFEQLDEIFSIIDPKQEMGLTFDFCHALESNQGSELLKIYSNRLCNVHMANVDHQPFLRSTVKLDNFFSQLNEVGYQGPITLELNKKTSIEKIIKTKMLFEKMINRY
ncbi:MAG: sugar phosphate isomerase/epimerase [Crenarchaeota archaeon]|nr:sugar phosphate isomerase/epimerase [Thermoproteota archaeon]